MNKSKATDTARIIAQDKGFECVGKWSILALNYLSQILPSSPLPQNQEIILDGAQITDLDSSGALILTHFIAKLKDLQNKVELVNFHSGHKDILDLVIKQEPNLDLPPKPIKHEDLLLVIGKETIQKTHQVDEFIILLGNLTIHFFTALRYIKRFHLPSIISLIYSTGLTALPILGLLAFLIGVVLAYQMGLQLETYGANIYIAYLSGLAIFREFGPLITAIIVAGRTSSSFTAQIGSMVINEEVDAIHSMGLSAVELLVLPKVIALTFIFPLLIFWSDVFSVLGSMFMSKSYLGVGYIDFLDRLRDSVGSEQFYRGLYKAPAFSIIIALVGCFQGFRVQASTDSIGFQTTKSVVQAIFLIIVADATYSVIYSWMDL
ncbi:MAG: ABC transporter permease [Legionellales bacterium RIFCSPHIGHO2_12_FULL_37_14]|nr:MAG: ABC transporter permease [Legionellales bacterium RIFCSPHIGHO2_12_FULL_37_14]